MILQFKVNNFRSIKDTVTFSINTGGEKVAPNSFSCRGYNLLKSAVIYGANASGKSNVLKAMGFMREVVLNVTKVTQSTDKLPHTPFRLNTETEHASSTFEIIFLKDNNKYRYGFEMDNSTVFSEWLFIDEKGREARLFERDIESELFYVNKQRFKEGVRVKVLDNQLFIWKCDQEKGSISGTILQWFHDFNFIDGLENKRYFHFALDQMKNTSVKAEMLDLLQKADLGIDGMTIEEQEIPFEKLENIPLPLEVRQHLLEEKKGLKSTALKTNHKKFDSENHLVGMEPFDLTSDESQGTQKFFSLSAPILDTLREGKILLIDELDASLHPKLTEAFVRLFHNPDINKHNAQLIFTTHDTNLLSIPELFDREQIWFTEKDQYGSTDLYSLLEFRKNNSGKDIRYSDNLEKHYLQGQYGATPYLGDF